MADLRLLIRIQNASLVVACIHASQACDASAFYKYLIVNEQRPLYRHLWYGRCFKRSPRQLRNCTYSAYHGLQASSHLMQLHCCAFFKLI